MAEAALRTARVERPPQVATVRVETDKLTAMYGKFTAVKGVSLTFDTNRVHALIGPSGCGKSTFLRTINRMHELSELGWITGRVLLDGDDIYASKVNAMQLRRRVGMVFQRPTPLPTMSIYDNVAAGLRVGASLPRAETDALVERSLQQAARVAEFTGFFLLGKMIEFDKTEKIFTNPSDKRTEDYITGRFG